MKVLRQFMSGREPGRVWKPGDDYTPGSPDELRSLVIGRFIEEPAPAPAAKPSRRPAEATPPPPAEEPEAKASASPRKRKKAADGVSDPPEG